MEYFITGTDTDCGKTLVTRGLMWLAHHQGIAVAGMKPVASGGIASTHGLHNADALAIQKLCSSETPYHLVNPYCFEPAIAPHIAAEMEGTAIEPGVIEIAREQLAKGSELLFIEGVGGWRVPLGDELDVADLCRFLQLPVILVVGVRLGCINHALLTVDAIRALNVPLAGWVANCVDPQMAVLEENITTLKSRIDAPLLGTVPWLEDATAETAAGYLRLP